MPFKPVHVGRTDFLPGEVETRLDTPEIYEVCEYLALTEAASSLIFSAFVSRLFLIIQSISSRTANTTPLEPGMIVSNEPGYYKPGGFGVRIENLLEIVDSGISNEALGRRCPDSSRFALGCFRLLHQSSGAWSKGGAQITGFIDGLSCFSATDCTH